MKKYSFLLRQSFKTPNLVGIYVSFFPIVIGFILYLINPGYIGELFSREAPWVVGDMLPLGWVLLALVPILGLATYLFPFLVFLLTKPTALGLKRTIRMTSLLLTLLFLGLPNFFIILLSPAFLQVVRSGVG